MTPISLGCQGHENEALAGKTARRSNSRIPFKTASAPASPTQGGLRSSACCAVVFVGWPWAQQGSVGAIASRRAGWFLTTKGRWTQRSVILAVAMVSVPDGVGSRNSERVSQEELAYFCVPGGCCPFPLHLRCIQMEAPPAMTDPAVLSLVMCELRPCQYH